MRFYLPLLALLACAAPVWADPATSADPVAQETQWFNLSFLSPGRRAHKAARPFAVFPIGHRLDFDFADFLRPGGAAGAAQNNADLPSLADAGDNGYESVGRAVSGWDFAFSSGKSSDEVEAGPQTSRGYDLTRARSSMRAGLNLRRENVSAFYGFGWKGDDLEGEPDDNLVGALQVQLRF